MVRAAAVEPPQTREKLMKNRERLMTQCPLSAVATKTTRELFKDDINWVQRLYMAIVEIYDFNRKIHPQGVAVFDVTKENVGEDGFHCFEDKSRVILKPEMWERSAKLFSKVLLEVVFKQFSKHIKTNYKSQGRKSSTGQETPCLLGDAIMHVVRETSKSLTYKKDGVTKHMLDDMPMLSQGISQKSTINKILILNSKVNISSGKSKSSSQTGSAPMVMKSMNPAMRAAFAGSYPGVNIYIKLPVVAKVMKVHMDLLDYPESAPFKALVKRHGVKLTARGKGAVYSFDPFTEIKEGRMTKVDYLNAIPYITEECRKKLRTNFASESTDNAKLKENQDLAMDKDWIEGPLNTLQVIRLTMPDFDPDDYALFYSNNLQTINTTTLTDLQKVTDPKYIDQALEDMNTLKNPEIQEQLKVEAELMAEYEKNLKC